MKGAIIMTYKSFVKKFRKGLKEELGKWGYKVNEDPTSDDIWLISFKGETRGTIVIDVRPNEYYQNEYLFAFLQNHMKKCELTARSFRLRSSHIDEQHPLVQRCKAMGLQPFGSPTLSDQALMPFPSFKLGPGDSARSHSADEFICFSEIEKAIATYVELLS